MKLALIAAVADNNAIGINNKMPWYLPGDLRYFKAVTMGKPVIMGRKTFDSLGKPLPGRTNIVITRDHNWHHEGVSVVHNLDDGIALAEAANLINGNEEIMIIGGEQIYRQAIDQADRLYLTRVYQSFDGDAFFPDINPQEWREISREDTQSEDEQPLTYSYLVLDRA
ncbi:dihydrofolate reductase [Endozoicomonas sp. GU-1]|uniref:dihydrofolate reductase n=1 Tax=Endozoicomonas sp. GU-1 TaxID=3009078 RepID=UPI0022B59B15|nr:dihydrofolate reductase [Endozoicomonas sp. GU-1]WBA82453.1 dihydrofolate reductase [Endozoicomonas sp. GU-1]WBA85386.1 dihydrofolate reductase [Endozoicomonas sp. GU-1]